MSRGGPERDMVQYLPAKPNGKGVPNHIPKRRVFTEKDWKRWVRYAERHTIAESAEHFGIVPSMLYTARARLAASKPRRADSKAKGGGSKGSGKPARRASYKPAGSPPRGAGIGDAVTYLRHAADRAARLGKAGYPVLGLVCLALEALGAAD